MCYHWMNQLPCCIVKESDVPAFMCCNGKGKSWMCHYTVDLATHHIVVDLLIKTTVYETFSIMKRGNILFYSYKHNGYKWSEWFQIFTRVEPTMTNWKPGYRGRKPLFLCPISLVYYYYFMTLMNWLLKYRFWLHHWLDSNLRISHCHTCNSWHYKHLLWNV